MTQPGAILSLFPGAGLLCRAFTMEGFFIARGPDLITGGDIRDCDPPSGLFWAVIAGPPCQDFSSLRRSDPTGNGLEMLRETRRVIEAAKPECWLVENVSRVPDFVVPGYTWQRFEIDQGWYVPVSRLRHWQFGSRSGTILCPPKGRMLPDCEPAALANDSRTVAELRRLQGLPDDWDLPGWTIAATKAAIGNGVPVWMGRAVARALRAAYGLPCLDVDIEPGPAAARRRTCACHCGRTVQGTRQYATATCRKRAHRRRRNTRLCECGCGIPVTGRQRYAGPACRKRAQRKRDAAVGRNVTSPAAQT